MDKHNTQELAEQKTRAVLDILRGELAKENISKRELAERIDVSYPTMIRYMSAVREMPMPVLFRIIQVLEIDEQTFWDEVGTRAVLIAAKARRSAE